MLLRTTVVHAFFTNHYALNDSTAKNWESAETYVVEIRMPENSLFSCTELMRLEYEIVHDCRDRKR